MKAKITTRNRIRQPGSGSASGGVTVIAHQTPTGPVLHCHSRFLRRESAVQSGGSRSCGARSLVRRRNHIPLHEGHSEVSDTTDLVEAAARRIAVRLRRTPGRTRVQNSPHPPQSRWLERHGAGRAPAGRIRPRHRRHRRGCARASWSRRSRPPRAAVRAPQPRRTAPASRRSSSRASGSPAESAASSPAPVSDDLPRARRVQRHHQHRSGRDVPTAVPTVPADSTRRPTAAPPERPTATR